MQMSKNLVHVKSRRPREGYYIKLYRESQSGYWVAMGIWVAYIFIDWAKGYTAQAGIPSTGISGLGKTGAGCEI